MLAKGRIGLIMPEINSYLDHEFLNGVYEQAQTIGYDVIVYTGILNSQREVRFDSYIACLENIYTLIYRHRLDGIIFAAERFHTNEVIEKIADHLRRTEIPTVVLGRDNIGSECCEAEEYSGMYEVTRHLIEKHSAGRLYCITGIPGHKSSDERLRGFMTACNDFGVEVKADDIFYGYFWKDIPMQIGREIAEGKIEKPDAVVCASDVMAAALVNSLMANGMSVPGDIAVTGYDGSWDSLVCTPSVTTVQGRDRQYGADSVCRIYRVITGSECENIGCRQSIRYGCSCGCSSSANSEFLLENYIRSNMQRSIEKHSLIATDIVTNFSDAVSLQELSQRIDETGHIFRDVKRIDVCLCSDWQADSDCPNKFRQYDFSENMYLLLSKRFGDNDNAHYSFPTADILPYLNKPHETSLTVLTTLHSRGQIFGYIAMAYEDSSAVMIDEAYVSWCDAVANGLRAIQKQMLTESFYHRLEMLGTTDPVTGMCNRNGMLKKLPEFINRYRYRGKRIVLLLLTYTPDKIGTVDAVHIISGIISENCANRLCSRIQNNVFAVVLATEYESNVVDETETFTAMIEKILRERFVTEDIPEFVTDVTEISEAEISDFETILEKSLEKLNDKHRAIEENNTDYKEQIYRLRRNIISSPQNNWDIREIASRISVSRSHLQRLYKQFFSVSIKDDVINARMKKAAQLLTNTNLRIQEIAYRCGYNNENHFMRQFKEKTGVTPSVYRRQSA